MRARAASLLVLASISAGLLLAACNDDGRTLRDPRPDQVGSVSTLAPSTTAEFIDTLPSDTLPSDTLPGEPLDPFATDPPAIVTVTIASQPPADPQFGLAGSLFSSFVDGGAIDVRHTCDGADLSPPLSWSPSPTGTQEIALTAIDIATPDAPLWVMSGVDPFATSLAEGVVPEFAILGTNDRGVTGYSGPCPAAGDNGTYLFTVHFLDQVTELADGTPAADLQAFVKGATFQSASVTGTYSQS